MSEPNPLHDHPLPVADCWRCDLKTHLITMRMEIDLEETDGST